MGKVLDCLSAFLAAVKPRKAMSVSEWADANRILTGKQSGERGPWRTRRNPILKEIMDCFSTDSRVSTVVVMKSSQGGVTEAMVNTLGYIIDHAPAPAMVLMPTIEARDAWKIQKLNPLFTDTPIVRDLLGGLKSRDAANSKEMIDFPGGILFLAGGNSPNSYAQRSVRYIFLDDLDRFPAEIGNEGDPVKLAQGRTKAFSRARMMLVSTPTVSGQSLIEREFLKSDQRRYHVPCPHCGFYQRLEWGGPDNAFGIKFRSVDEIPVDAWYECISCHARIDEIHKPRMLAAGRWVAHYPGRPIRGYQFSALTSPIGLGPAWLDLAREWKEAVKTPGTLQAFINTHLGEPWEEEGDVIDPTGLLARLESFEEMPRPLYKTAFADVQKDRIEVTLVGWQVGEEGYVMNHLILPGDTAQNAVWESLSAEMSFYAPDCMGVDSGYNTSMVYAFCEKRKWAFATKGVPGPGRPIVEDAKARAQRLRYRRRRGVPVYLVGVDQAKALIYSRLNLQRPGPGYLHFPQEANFDDEYFAQLTAEKLVPKMRGLRTVYEWKAIRPRNEALDCMVGNLAVLRLSGADLDELAARRQREDDARNRPAAPAPDAKTRFGNNRKWFS